MQATAKPSVLSVGRLYCDLIFTDLPRLPTLGTEVFSDGFGMHAGGGAFITAAHLSMLGHRSALATMLPAPPFSDLVRPDLDASGVDLSLCTTLPASAGPQITVAMVEQGDRAFLTHRAGPPFPRLTAADLAQHGLRHVHVGELASLVAEPDLIPLARQTGMTISVDCSWDEAMTADDIRPLARTIDVFLPNEAEYDALRAMGLADSFAPVTIVKRGAAGATAITEAGTLDVPTTAIEAVDTTGAGDAFNAGFLSAWLTGQDMGDCLAAGNVQGAIAVQQSGGFNPAPPSPDALGVAGR